MPRLHFKKRKKKKNWIRSVFTDQILQRGSRGVENSHTRPWLISAVGFGGYGNFHPDVLLNHWTTRFIYLFVYLLFTGFQTWQKCLTFITKCLSCRAYIYLINPKLIKQTWQLCLIKWVRSVIRKQQNNCFSSLNIR